MVVTEHLLLYTNIQNIGGHDIQGALIFLIRCAVKINVNVLVITSGYLLFDKQIKPVSILLNIAQVQYYALLSLVGVYLLTGEVSIKMLASALMPILSNAYWFMTCYVGLMILAPVLNLLFNDKNIKQLTASIAVIYIILTIYPFPYFRQLATEVGAGRSLQHFIVLYLTGGLLKRITQAGVSRSVSRIAKSACMIAFSVSVLSKAFLSGNPNLQVYNNVFFTNNSPTIYLCASMVCLLVMNTKVNCSETTRKTIEILARYTLGVYLLHDGVLRPYLWDNVQRLLVGRMNPVLVILVLPMLIYILCTIIDQPRVYLEEKMKKVLSGSNMLLSRQTDWSK